MEGLYRLERSIRDCSWELLKSSENLDDGKKYVFKLSEDAKWSNGEPVTAKDFVYSWKRAVDPDTSAKYCLHYVRC